MVNAMAKPATKQTTAEHLTELQRRRAEQARTLADQMSEARTKAIMLEIAASYEKIAKWADERRDEPR
jgi:hypothetical protein